MIIDGKQIADRILEEIKTQARGRGYCMVAVLIGDDPGLTKFVELKRKAADSVGIKFRLINLPATITQGEIESITRNLNADPTVHGIFIELPLPNYLNKTEILNLISIEKDVDLLSHKAKKNFEDGDFSVLPPTVFAIDQILKEFNIDPTGKSVALFGMGELVGGPASVWFKKMGSSVKEIDEYTNDPEQYSRRADIIVSGVGKSGVITVEMVKEGATVFDFGYGNKGSKTMGDISGDVAKKAGLLTPVPGGVGPLVVATIFHNLILLNREVKK